MGMLLAPSMHLLLMSRHNQGITQEYSSPLDD
jgi:hypothetical protein